MTKTLHFFVLLLAAVLVGSCATKVQLEPALPCSVEDETETLYIRKVGIGVSANLQQARWESLSDAKIKILSHLLNVPFSKDSIALLQTDILPFEKECEKVYFNDDQYYVYTRLATLTPDEARLLYYREQFRKYAEKKKKQMFENQKDAPSESIINDSDSINVIQKIK